MHTLYIRIYLRRYVRMYVRIYARMIAYVYRILDCHFISLKTHGSISSLNFHRPSMLSSFFVPQVELFEISRPCSPKKNTEKVQGNFGRDMSHQAFDPCHSTEGSQMFEENSSSVQNAEVQFNSTDPSFQTKYRIFCKLSISTSNATSLRKGMI